MGNLHSFAGPGDWARPGNTPNHPSTHAARLPEQAAPHFHQVAGCPKKGKKNKLQGKWK